MSSGSHDPKETASLINELWDIAQVVEHDDLSKLAKMHGYCETLAGHSEESPSSPYSDLGQAVSNAARVLEEIILGEVDDVRESLAEMKQYAAAAFSLSGQFSGGDGQPTEQAQTVDETPTEATEQPIAEKQPTAETQSDAVDEITDEAFDADLASAMEATPPPEATAEAAPAEQAEAAPAEPAEAAEEQAPPEPAYVPEPLFIDTKEIDFVAAFVEEAEEHIESIEAAVLGVEQAPDDEDKINDLFRPFHTIKGMAGFLNLRDIGSVTHEVETLIDQARKGKRSVTAGMIDIIFEVVDILKAAIGSIKEHLADPKDEVVPQPPVAAMIAVLQDVIAGRKEPSGAAPTAGTANNTVGENLVESGACSKEIVDFALQKQEASTAPKKTGELLIEMDTVTPKQVSQALRAQKATPAAASKKASSSGESIRIDTQKLDTLVDMVGELVIAQAQVSANPTVYSSEKLGKDVSHAGKIVRDLQEAAMAMRMIPIGATFQKMARLVRDVSRKAGKEVELAISGEDTELDKNVIQQIGDPLVHMVRNAIDHGVESPADRTAVGKPPVGRVSLRAHHHAGNIVIDIQDDGKGLDRDKLTAKAIKKGLISPEDELTDEQAYQLVFAPGFSTAEQVTDISGRGVGMDVVKRNIEQLRGKVEISSELGQGSTFSIRLPLTLAIIDGMILGVGGEKFIIQTINIEQSLRPHRSQITTVQRRGEVLNLRGKLIPLVQLGALFGLTGRIDPCDAMVIVANHDGGQVGLVVEDLLGQQQVVIKTLGERFRRLEGVSGAAILGDGKIGLILEVSGIVSSHDKVDLSSFQEMQDDLQTMTQEEDGAIASDDAGTPEDAELVDEQEALTAASVAAD